MTSSSLFKLLPILTVCMISACSENSPRATASDDTGTATAPRQSSEQTSADTDQNVDVASNDTMTTAVRSADSHIHGNAELAIVIEGNVITIEMDTSLYNILGYEHHPETVAQEAKVKQAEDILQNGQSLFEFNKDAQCELTSGNTPVKLFEDDDDGHDDHNHHHDESHDSHDEDHANHESTHKDLILQYEYRCATTSSLSNVRLNLFEYFDDLSDIDVTYLGSSTQKQVTMTGKNSQMDLSQ